MGPCVGLASARRWLVSKKHRCPFCKGLFRPDPRVSSTQWACRKPECQRKRRAATQSEWRRRNPDYFVRRRLVQRAAAARAVDEAVEDPRKLRPDLRRPAPLRVPAVLRRVPWLLAQDELGVVATDFLAVTARELVAVAQDPKTGNALS